MTTPVLATPSSIHTRHDLKPGDVGYLIYLHGMLYAREYGWDHTFEAYVAGPLAEFGKSHSERERIWIVEQNETITGAIGIVERTQHLAQLRWFLLHPDLRGRGIGRALIEDAIRFCRDSQYHAISLWTVSALTAAATLYQSTGFQLMEEHEQRLWGTTLIEQRYELAL